MPAHAAQTTLVSGISGSHHVAAIFRTLRTACLFPGILFAGSMRFLGSFHYGFYCDEQLRNLYSLLMFVACCSE